MQELLEFAESLNMSEGNYLKVANALRDVFPKLDEEAPTLQWKQTLPVGEFRMILSDFAYSTGITRIVYDFTTCKLMKKLNKGVSAGWRIDYGIGCTVVYEYPDKQIERNKTIWHSMHEIQPIARPKKIELNMQGVEYMYTLQQFCKDQLEYNHQLHLMNGNSEDEWDEFEERDYNGSEYFNKVINMIETHIHKYCNNMQTIKEIGLDLN